MKPKSSSLFPFMIILMIILNTSSTTVVADFIQKTCKKCEKNNPNVDYDFCVSSFRSHPGSDSADLRKLGAISLHLIRNNVSSSVEYVEGLLHKKELDPYRRARLNDCLELYAEAVVSLEEGKKAYRENLYDDVNIKVSSVMDAGRVCEDGFSEKEGVSSPLTRWNKDMFKLTAIALSIINMLS